MSHCGHVECIDEKVLLGRGGVSGGTIGTVHGGFSHGCEISRCGLYVVFGQIGTLKVLSRYAAVMQNDICFSPILLPCERDRRVQLGRDIR
jgi:hypothetical protein